MIWLLSSVEYVIKNKDGKEKVGFKALSVIEFLISHKGKSGLTEYLTKEGLVLHVY